MIDRRMLLAAAFALATAASLRPGVLPAAAAESKGSSDAGLEPLLRYGTWLAARPAADDLRGKVVLVDVFTFGCGNCQNVTPNLRALYRKHDANLAIVGVHTPETPYETDRSNVAANLAKQGIAWPVAIDNAHTLWDAYAIEYWPTQLIFDKHGVLRKTVVGDSQDSLVDDTIAALLKEK
jgi:thiol-disulfide isomerase/thioredoxin